ncbi:cytidylyltransferase domain-containing protein [Sulfurimonas sp.]|uniref:acylneuraminate cytidylyltransferase family protein n=1 Tax=Sulfurimonas sp. TaxID=2022749 RepID=UPI00356B1BD3
MEEKILAIIPARAGSKGIKDKNIINLNSKPLIAWSIEASTKSKFITKTIVSSDADNILDIAKQYGASTIRRPDNLALDSTPSEDVIKHTIDLLENENEIYDYLILLQPTSPIRDQNDIDKAFSNLFKTDANALISVYKEDSKILKTFKENKNGYIEGISNNDFPFMPRQSLPPVYMSNGAIYIIKVSEFSKTKKLFTDKTIFYEMSKRRSIDIDSLSDLNEAKKQLDGENI